MKWIKKIKAS